MNPPGPTDPDFPRWLGEFFARRSDVLGPTAARYMPHPTNRKRPAAEIDLRRNKEKKRWTQP